MLKIEEHIMQFPMEFKLSDRQTEYITLIIIDNEILYAGLCPFELN